jgi:hypothetical protein
MILWKTDKEIDKIARMIFTSTIPLVKKIQQNPPNHLGGFCCIRNY